MIIFNDVDPTTNPFNDFMKNYGIWIAVGVAAIILIVVLIVFFASTKRKGGKNKDNKVVPVFDNSLVIKALGDKENIISTCINGSRIAIELKDTSKVDENSLKANSVKSIIKMSNKITLLVEGDPNEFYNRIFRSNEL